MRGSTKFHSAMESIRHASAMRAIATQRGTTGSTSIGRAGPEGSLAGSGKGRELGGLPTASSVKEGARMRYGLRDLLSATAARSSLSRSV